MTNQTLSAKLARTANVNLRRTRDRGCRRFRSLPRNSSQTGSFTDPFEARAPLAIRSSCSQGVVLTQNQRLTVSVVPSNSIPCQTSRVIPKWVSAFGPIDPDRSKFSQRDGAIVRTDLFGTTQGMRDGLIQ